MGKTNMIRVGFVGAISKEWMGGVNYFNNLLYAISVSTNREIEPIVFIGIKTDNDIKNMYYKYAKVIEHSMFDRKSLQWYIWKVLYSTFGITYPLKKLLKQEKIDILSHSNIVGLDICKTINWIPDFQHLHLSNMFSKKEISKRNASFIHIIQKSDMVVLSSYDALSDFRNFAPQFERKARVLQFVSQPSLKCDELTEEDKINLQKKYLLPKEFYYLPNQFWQHKNHMLVFKAIKELVNKGSNVYLVCTGYLQDYRSVDYIAEVKAFIQENNLENNIRLLGLVDYEDVFLLINFSKAVINPSLFEGWSSTVEECKSMGKNMILSNLNVHKEQYPEALFFDRNNVNSLVDVLSINAATMNKPCIKYQKDIEDRIKTFGETFQRIVVETFYNQVNTRCR